MRRTVTLGPQQKPPIVQSEAASAAVKEETTETKLIGSGSTTWLLSMVNAGWYDERVCLSSWRFGSVLA